MGKISNILYMIDLLNTGNIYSLKELSEKIGVTERMIRYYKNEICNNGIIIETFKGPNGGYFMIDKIKNYTNVNKYDIQLLDSVKQILINSNFEYIDKYDILLDKLKKTYTIYEEKSKFISNIDISSYSDIEKALISAKEKNDKIEIIYSNVDGKQYKRVIHPLYLFEFKDIRYVTAFCELRNDIRHFEINRIIKIK